MSIQEYESKLANDSYALRVGKQVPEGDVNLAYVHVPKVQADENVSLINTTYMADNVIPQDQLESIVVANAQGELEYVDIIDSNEVRPRPPQNIFPSKKFLLTNQFKKNEMRTENALYYKFEIQYHYDSQRAIPDEDGTYPLQKYTGQQISITDENGNSLDDTYKYEIYVQAHAENPRIYTVVLYLHQSTNKEQTIRVRYNHIDHVTKNELIQSVRNQIELYQNVNNEIQVDSKTKQMLEGGKLRIVNGTSAYRQATMEEVQQSIAEQDYQEIYALVEREDGTGYKIVVAQKSESDPRTPTIFAHRVVANFQDSNGNPVKRTVGHITDWCINPEALLAREKMDYTEGWKNIGLPAGAGKLTAKDMITVSLPFDALPLPSEVTYSIEDDKGNLLYSNITMTDNSNVITKVNEFMMNKVEAQVVAQEEEVWENAMQKNTILKSIPIPHQCSVIAERQKMRWEFEWEADGEGIIGDSNSGLAAKWQACANVGFKLSAEPNVLNLNDATKWQIVGVNEATNNSMYQLKKEDWQYQFSSLINKNALVLTTNKTGFAGYYQLQENINGVPKQLKNLQNYEISTKIQIKDQVDDDVIGIIFRLKDEKNFYCFAWEADRIQQKKTQNDPLGTGSTGTLLTARVHMSEYGVTMMDYDETGSEPENWKNTNNLNKYLNERGFGQQHKRIFRVTPSTYPKSSETDPDSYNWNGTTQYPSDFTGCSFTDITTKDSLYSSAVGKKGWEANKEYKITVVVNGDNFQIYINENANSSERGTLVCQATDSVHKNGTYGVYTVSTAYAFWYDLKITEIAVEEICAPEKSITFIDNNEKKLDTQTIEQYLKPYIQEKAVTQYRNSVFEVYSYDIVTKGSMTARVDATTKFMYGKASSVISNADETWSTKEVGLTVHGTGVVEFFGDGRYTVSIHPSTLPMNIIPSEVKNFKWNRPIVTQGENVELFIGERNRLYGVATPYPIEQLGKFYALPSDSILKTDGLKHIAYIFDTLHEEGIYKQLNIPEEIPLEEISLRLERGIVKGVQSNGNAVTTNPEYRVNYRFRCQYQNESRLPVDQFQNTLGVNRLRLKSILDKSKQVRDGLLVDVVAWTTFEELEAVPVYSIKLEEERKIEIEKPKVNQDRMMYDNWYMRVKNGHFLKRIQLPYYDAGALEKVPQIYVMYPQLLGRVASPEDIVEVDLEYTIPEYAAQEYHNGNHIVVDKEVPIILNEYAIQTRYQPLVLATESQQYPTEVYRIRGNRERRLRISDIDASKGIIYLLDRIKEDDELYVRYLYQEDWYTYRGFIRGKRTIGGTGDIDVTKILALYKGTPFTGSGNNHDNFFTMLNNRGIAVDELSVTAATLEKMKEYPFVIISNIFNAFTDDEVAMVRQYFAEGGSGIVCSEHAGLTSWYSTFDKIMQPYSVKTDPMSLIFTNGTFNPEHPLTSPITDLQFSMSAASTIVLDGSEFVPLAYAPSGQVMAAAYLKGNQRITVLSDSNFLTNHGINDPNNLTNGNIALIDRIISGIILEETPILDAFYHLDLNPTPGHYHTVGEHENEIVHQIPICTNIEKLIASDRPNKELLVKPIHIYLAPYAVRNVVTSNAQTIGPIIPGTLNKQTLYHTDQEQWFNPNDYQYNPALFRLGKVIVQANSSMEDHLTILDTRTRGGGLDERITKDIIKQVNPESLYHWDIGYFDGEAYQENGVVVIRLPEQILQSDKNPTGYHQSYVEQVVAKYKAFGVLPIIEYYDAEKVDEFKYNLLPNYEFLEAKHIGYYNEEESKGDYSIYYSLAGTNDNYVLELNNDAEYVILVPGYRFDHSHYRVDIKAMRPIGASKRKIGTVELYYMNGEKERFEFGTMEQMEQWMIYKQTFEIKSPIQYVKIILNRTTEPRTGKIFIDYVVLVPVFNESQDDVEIYEI